MNIPKYSLENSKIIYFFLAVMLIGGVYSFFKLPKKEDAPFVIKQAVLVTQYPGATPFEVEKLVTEPIEREIQSMSDVLQIKSESYFGMSKISIELQPTLDPDNMPVKWDELRRKVANIEPRLPSGASQALAWYAPEVSWYNWLGLSATVVLFGTWGDLIESLLKRTLGVKDSGNVLPGHGGMLDRFDSLMLAAPAAYIYIELFIRN